MNTRLQVQTKTTPKPSFTPVGRNLLQHRSTEQAEPPLVPPILHEALPTFQAKLTIGQPNDKYEQEADRLADQVMRMPEPKIQRVCPECEEELQRQPMEEEEEEEETLQTKPLAEQITPLVQRQTEPMEEEEEETLQTKTTSGQLPTVSSSLHNRITALQGEGQPLPQSERAFFEPRFSTDFSQVRVHADSRAAETANAVNARAFTVGRDIVFGAGQYQPSVNEGRRLMAHELTHVLQQEGSGIQRIQRERASRLHRPRVPPSLLRQPVLTDMSQEDLLSRYDEIIEIEGRLVRYLEIIPRTAPDRRDVIRQRDQLSRESGRIGEEFARRHAPAIQRRTFARDAIRRMRDFFVANARRNATLPREERTGCYETLRLGLSQLFGEVIERSPRRTIEETMARLQVLGRAGSVREIYFLDSRGQRIERGSPFRPIRLEENVSEVVMQMAGGEAPSVFGLSLLDGFHSVTLRIRSVGRGGRRIIYWYDQFGERPYGPNRSSRRDMDTRIVRDIQRWWDDEADVRRKPFAIIRLWRINQPPPATHTVRTGETLSEIAGRYSTDVDTLMQLNDIDDADRIQAGQELVLPGRSHRP